MNPRVPRLPTPCSWDHIMLPESVFWNDWSSSSSPVGFSSSSPQSSDQEFQIYYTPCWQLPRNTGPFSLIEICKGCLVSVERPLAHSVIDSTVKFLLKFISFYQKGSRGQGDFGLIQTKAYIPPLPRYCYYCNVLLCTLGILGQFI